MNNDGMRRYEKEGREEKYRNPITKEEIQDIRRGLRLLDEVTLKNAVVLRDSDDTYYRKEKCQVIAKYRHVVIFRRPNGRTCSRTYVELCMLNRGVAI